MRLVIPIVLVLALVGCQQPQPRLNAPPHGMAPVSSELRDEFAAMADNALLADMSVTDIHFVPHRAVLNSLGAERMSRLCMILELYGGAIRFSSDESDPRLVDARTEAIRSYLREGGIDTTAETVVRDLPGGAGMEAQQAILIKQDAMGAKSAAPTAAPTAQPVAK